MHLRAWLALACAGAALACEHGSRGSHSQKSSTASTTTTAGAPPLASVRQMPAIVPVRRPDGRPFGGAKERMARDAYDLECDGGARAVTCDDFLGGAGKACPPQTMLASVSWTNADLDCRALDLVVRGVGSTVSFLRTFTMATDHAGDLPAALWMTASPQRNAAMERAGVEGKSLRDAVSGVHQTVATPERAKYESKDDWLEVIVFAFGDFGSPHAAAADGGAGPPDGVEDVVIEARSGPLQGTAFYAVLWVLTRHTATGPFEVVSRSS